MSAALRPHDLIWYVLLIAIENLPFPEQNLRRSELGDRNRGGMEGGTERRGGSGNHSWGAKERRVGGSLNNG